MKKVPIKKTWYHTITDSYQSLKMQHKKKMLRLKIKLFFTVFLPIIIILLGTEVLRTFIRIRIRKLFSGPLPKD
ncbi:hypothetical protein [Lacrimispora sp.]|uniref:hypothetical protein n=1 Tax=Lacrimispora sp. TaxID=2719234 RepID=UPI003217DF22